MLELPDFTERAVSSSALKALKKSIRHFAQYYSKPWERKLHFDFGNAIELYLLDKEDFKKKVVVLDESKRPVPDKNYQTKENKAWKDNFLELHKDKLIVSNIGADSLETMDLLEKLLDNHPSQGLVHNGSNIYQEEFHWNCPVTGLKRYARTDITNWDEGYILDMKTYADDSFERAAQKQDHFLQAWDQIQGALANGKPVKKYYWLAISKTAPYFVDLVEFNLDATLRVEESYAMTLSRLKEALEEGVPSYTATCISKLSVPNYYK